MNISLRPCLRTGCLISLALVLTACSARKTDTTDEEAPTGENSGPFGSDDPNATSVLLASNYSTVVGHALSFFANERFPGPTLIRIGPPAFTEPQSTTVDPTTGVETGFFTCINGGEASRVDNGRDPTVYQFTNCQYEDTILDGQYGLIFGKYNLTQEFNNFVADINGGTAIHEVTGAMVFKTSSPPCSSFVRTRSVEQYKITLADRTFEIKDWDTSYEKASPVADFCDEDTLEIAGRFSLRSDITKNNWLVITATETITGTSDNPTDGVITINAADRSKITLDFANGDDTSVSVTIENRDGESTFDEPLSSWINSLLP